MQNLIQHGATLLLISGVALSASQAHSDDIVSFDVVLGGGALICDHAESVVIQFQGARAPDCGILQTRTGMSATVTIIGEYEGPDRVFPLARFEFHTPTPWDNQVQYGWWAGDLPAATPAGIAL